MVVLFFADIFGRPGRKAIAAALPALQKEFQPDFVIGNAENLAGGRGVNKKTFNEMIEMGFHAMTGGNHTWDNRDVYWLLENDHRLLRPSNFPSPAGYPCPGKGHVLLEVGGKRLLLINLLGRVFMDALECPFAAVDRVLAEHRGGDYPILVDMHCDATSEKYAMGWHLDGRVSAMVGSHSHVQTADERILPGGTAYITDVGMTGAFDSVIGLRPAEIVKKFITKRPHSVQTATENPGISCVVIEIRDDHRAKSIVRVRRSVEVELDPGKENE